MAQTGAEASAEAGAEAQAEIIPILKAIAIILEKLQKHSLACGNGNPGDYKPKIHVMDLRRRKYVRHYHKPDGDHVVVETPGQ